MDNELFELCKEVYEKTRWRDTDFGFVASRVKPVLTSKQAYEVPLYTSDYLLEKLPKKVVRDDIKYWLSIYPMDNIHWGCGYTDDGKPDANELLGVWDVTLLKALLKLTLALAEAGELKYKR